MKRVMKASTSPAPPRGLLRQGGDDGEQVATAVHGLVGHDRKLPVGRAELGRPLGDLVLERLLGLAKLRERGLVRGDLHAQAGVGVLELARARDRHEARDEPEQNDRRQHRDEPGDQLDQAVERVDRHPERHH
jgi:hypothetical protein